MKTKRHRQRGTGTVYKKDNGSWRAQIFVGDKRVSKTFTTKWRCEKWIESMTEPRQLESHKEEEYICKLLLADYLDQWIETVKNTLRPWTYYHYKLVVDKKIKPVLGNTYLEDLRPFQIQTFYNDHVKKGNSVRSVRHIHSVLRRALNVAIKWELLTRNPCSSVIVPVYEPPEMKVLNVDQVRILLDSVKGTANEAFYYIAVTTGLRMGELLGLFWTDVEWNTRQLRIQRQLLMLPGGEVIYSRPKSKAGRRLVLLGPTGVDILKSHKELQELEATRLGERWHENGLIFPSAVGTPKIEQNVRHSFKPLLKKNGLPNIRFHDLRHTSATLMLQMGIHPKIVQERLGHSRIDVTLDQYSHVLPSMQKEAALLMDNLIEEDQI